MAVADHFTGFAPVAGTEPKSAVLGQVESAAYARVGRQVEKVVTDLRGDVDDALQRGFSKLAQDPDLANAVPIGVALLDDAQISVAATDNTVIAKGDFKAEPGHASPAKAEVTIGAGTSALTYTARLPGNGNNDYPNGDRILIIHRDPEANNQSLGARTAVVELEGRNYRCIVIDLATDAGGVITTTADDVAALVDADMTNYVSVVSGGAGLVAGMADGAPVQLEDGAGGFYGVFISDFEGTWTWWPVVTWTDAAVTLVDIDGTAGPYVAGGMMAITLVANGIASTAWAELVA